MAERRWRFVIETSDMPDDLAAVWLGGLVDATADWPGAEVVDDEFYAYYELEGGERLFRVHDADACRGQHCTGCRHSYGPMRPDCCTCCRERRTKEAKP